MEVALAAIGRLKAGPEKELCERYLERARKSGARLGFRGFSVQEFAESRAPRPKDRIAQEDTALSSVVAAGTGRIIGLDAAGDLVDSQGFADWLARDCAASVARTLFIIGGPDGLGPAILGRSDRRLSLGRMTFPHQIVRILLAEQLYRAMTILSGHPYHRA
jgi:23S rRNA (pseudouridine1915-N3)-methyltransferase